MPRFKHLPLASATNEIRLLSLDPSGDLDDIHCTLVTHRLDAQPVYCALSYEWGDPDLPMEIKVNGNVFHARHNLWLFLHRLKAARRSPGNISWNPTSDLWIDALCVDQKNVAERSAQVQLMGRIYQEAYGVIVWLGWSDGLDTMVTATLAKETSTDPVHGLERYANFILNSSYQQIDLDRDAISHEVCDFISELCKKTYWTRRWIVQEILMAQKVLLVYGEQELPWAAVCMMFDRYTQKRTARKSSDEIDTIYYSTELSSLEDILESTAAKIWRHQSTMKASRRRSLATLLNDYRPLQCEALHDKVYSLKGLVMERTLDTDYSISASELFSRVFDVVLRQDTWAFRNWTSYAADCGLFVQPLRLPDMSARRQPIPSVTPIPLRTACKACVSHTMEFGMFEEGVKKLRAGLGLSMTSESASNTVSRLGRALETLSEASHYVFEVWRTVVEDGNFEVGKGFASHDAIFAGDNMRFLPSTTIDGDFADREGPAPTIAFCRKRNFDRKSYLCVTWSHVKAGDLLCQVVGQCYFILRGSGRYLQIVGPAWLLLNEEDTAILEGFFRRPDNRGHDDHSLWEGLFKEFLLAPDFAMLHYNDGSWENFETRIVEVRFEVMELIRLLQVDEQMRGVLGSSDWSFSTLQQNLP